MTVAELLKLAQCKLPGCTAEETKAIIWADGRAKMPVCSEHVEAGKKYLEQKNGKWAEIVAVRPDGLKKAAGEKKEHELELGPISRPLTRAEHEAIKRQLKERQKRPKRERDVEALVGAAPSTGQLMRHGAIAAGIGAAMHPIGTFIEGKRSGSTESLMRTALKPRAIARSAMTGAALAALAPVAKHTLDRYYAAKGEY